MSNPPGKRKRKRMWMRILPLLPCLAALCFVCVSWVYAQRLTRARPCFIGTAPKDFPYPCEQINLKTGDGETLAGWYVPGEPQAGAIILLHGYSGNRLVMVPRARFLRQAGYGVLLYDARANGESSGDEVTFGYRERHDLVAAVHFLKQRGLERIACLGVSQGGATILYAADQLQDVKCAICESVYDEMEHAVDRRTRHYIGIPGWLAASALVPFAERRLGLSMDDMKPSARIAALPCPVLIISGEEDERTWPEDTSRLFEAAREPKELWMIPKARHEDLFRYPGYQEKVASFLKRYL